MRFRSCVWGMLAAFLLLAPAAQAEAEESQRWEQADAELNKAYTALLGFFSEDPDATRRLKVAQRAWIAFRDGECDFMGQWTEGGSVHGEIIAMCMAGLTEARVKDLEYYLTCEEGDLTCPPLQ